MQCRISTLADNTSGKPDIIGEWGFCALVETGEATVLLDCGAGHAVLHNAEQMEIDLSKVDKIVLSHGHYDHTTGIEKVLREIGRNIEIIAPPDLWAAKYSVREGRKERYIGVPFTRESLEGFGAQFTLSSEPVFITDNMVTTGEVAVVTDFEQVGEDYLKIKVNGEYQRDSFLDDRALIVKTGNGLVIVLGCAHRCLINTLHHARDITGEDRIHMVIGGCHLFEATDDYINKTIAALREFKIDRIGVSHCTGLRAGAMMAAELGDHFFFNTAGTVITIE